MSMFIHSNNVGIANDQLLLGAGNGDMEAVAEALSLGADVNYTPRELTPLHLSIANQKQDMAIFLLEKGANPNSRNRYGWSPFHETARLGYEDLITSFIEQPFFISLNSKDSEGHSPLRVAVEANHTNFVSKLIEACNKDPENMLTDLNINSADNEGNSPLLIAVQKEMFDMAKVLFEAGANPSLKNKAGESPISISENKDHFLFLFGQKTQIEKEKEAISEDLSKREVAGISTITKKKRPS